MRRLWKGIGGWAGVLLLFFSPQVRAAEYSMEPVMSLSENYDTNPELGTLHRAATGTTFSPSSSFNALTERGELRGNAALNLTRYFDQENLNATEQFYQITSRYPFERNVFELQAGYSRDLTLTSELAETGLVLARKPRKLVTVAPKWSLELTGKLVLELDYQFADAHYSDPSLINYQTQQGTAQLVYSLSERDKLSLGFDDLTYHAPSSRIRSVESGTSLGLEHQVSETMKGALSAGIVRTASSFSGLPVEMRSREIGWSAEGHLEKQLETWSLRGGYSREIRPSGGGFLAEVNHLSLFVSKSVTSLLTASLSLDGYLTQAFGLNSPIPDSHYYKVEQRWDWQWNEHWFLSGSYRYAHQDLSGSPVKAASHALFLIMTYHSPKMAISR